MAAVRPLYGGAMTALLTPQFMDASDVRLVPDNQEVLVDAASDASIIVELLELDPSLTAANALSHHFNELAAANETQHFTVLSECTAMPTACFMPALAPHRRMALIGKQMVRKHHAANAPWDVVYICMVLVRLEAVTTDLLICLNLPIKGTLAMGDGDLLALDQALCPAVLQQAQAQGQTAALPQHALWEKVEVFRGFVNSLQIVDWGLFG